MLITKKEFKILKSNRVSELQKRKVTRKIEKRINATKCIFGFIVLELTFVISILYALNGYNF